MQPSLTCSYAISRPSASCSSLPVPGSCPSVCVIVLSLSVILETGRTAKQYASVPTCDWEIAWRSQQISSYLCDVDSPRFVWIRPSNVSPAVFVVFAQLTAFVDFESFVNVFNKCFHAKSWCLDYHTQRSILVFCHIIILQYFIGIAVSFALLTPLPY